VDVILISTKNPEILGTHSVFAMSIPDILMFPEMFLGDVRREGDVVMIKPTHELDHSVTNDSSECSEQFWNCFQKTFPEN
jgi:hypothetical protein